MTRDQSENWRQFAQRMAFAIYRDRTTTRRDRLVKEVGHLIDVFLSNYPAKDRGWGCLADVDRWDGSLMRPGEPYDQYRKRAAYPCDSFDGYVWDRGYIRETRGGEERGEFGSAIMCCIRAGFDVAIEPSAGVLGFDMGDIRAMFPEGFPPYVAAYLAGFTDDEGAPVDVAAMADDVRVWL